jgi:glycosyltransferase involved in cell wall biosynthesis
MRILLLSGMHPLPTNVARGTFVADHVRLLRDLGHDVRVVNPLPRMLRYHETRRSTLTGVAKAPQRFDFDGSDVLSPRYVGRSSHASAWISASSVTRRLGQVRGWLGEWRPEAVVVHGLWPVALLARRLATDYGVRCLGVVHGWDLDVGVDHPQVGPRLRRFLPSLDHLVVVGEHMVDRAQHAGAASVSWIPCHVPVEKDWRRAMRSWRGRWRRDPIDLLFPSDPRRPEKDHWLALQTGQELERRGWVVGMTTLRQQPRTIVWDRMMVASLTLITSSREAGPLGAKESIACGTPVAAVRVGDLERWLPERCLAKAREPTALADVCEAVLEHDWTNEDLLPAWSRVDAVGAAWTQLLQP